jgi:hypothetical protein
MHLEEHAYLGDTGVVELVPQVVDWVQGVRGVVTATGSAVMADDPDQVVRRFLQKKKFI